MPDRSPAYFHQHPDIQSPAVSRFFGNRSPNETITDTHPPYKWNSSSGATSYRLAVWSNASTSYVIDTDAASSYCTGGVCTYHPATVLADGNYRFKVLAKNAVDSSPYSAWMDFTLNTHRIYLPLVIRN